MADSTSSTGNYVDYVLEWLQTMACSDVFYLSFTMTTMMQTGVRSRKLAALHRHAWHAQTDLHTFPVSWTFAVFKMRPARDFSTESCRARQTRWIACFVPLLVDFLSVATWMESIRKTGKSHSCCEFLNNQSQGPSFTLNGNEPQETTSWVTLLWQKELVAFIWESLLKTISRVSTCEAGSPLGLLIGIFLDRNHGCYMSYSPTLPANLSQCKTPTIGQKKLNTDNVLASNVYFSNSFGFNPCSVVQYLFNVFLGLINQQSLSNDIK